MENGPGRAPRGNVRRGPNGEISLGWHRSSQDIDDYKKAVQALRECEAELRALQKARWPSTLPTDVDLMPKLRE